MDYNMYLLEMKVCLPRDEKYVEDPVKQDEQNKSFMEKELSKVLPKNILSGGYVCSVCETYLNVIPEALCSSCYRYYEDNHKDELEDKIKSISYVFSTSSDFECELTDVDFSKLENIKVISFSEVEPTDEYVESQNTIIFDGNKFNFTDEQYYELY